jgi:hypothetical protein
MARIPTDRETLEVIYKRYHDRFVAFDVNEPDRETKIMIPIDCVEIAHKLKVDPDIVFGRLYYHLEPKYGYERSDGTQVAFFARVAGRERNCINFPLMVSILAGLQEEWNKHRWALGMAIASLVLSIVAIVVSIVVSIAKP